MELFFIYDDMSVPDENIISIIGLQRYGDIVHKRKKLVDKVRTDVWNAGIQFHVLRDEVDLLQLHNRLDKSERCVYIHFLSNAVIVDAESFGILLQKAYFVDEVMVVSKRKSCMYFFPNSTTYKHFLRSLKEGRQGVLENSYGCNEVITPNTCILNISERNNFLKFFSGGFETRHFNHLTEDRFTISKTSDDKIKIKKEHDFYHLLPEHMKSWFVCPFDFRENTKTASYTMERLNVPDMAIQWVQNAISKEDMSEFLEKIFYFIGKRPIKKISRNLFDERFRHLYLKKVEERILQLKGLSQFKAIEKVLNVAGRGKTIDQIFLDYKNLFNSINVNDLDAVEVIGHGDLCFSNILYDKGTSLMKFIDPKGALSEGEMWTDMYYDLAKLSHSILGGYDFINNDMFNVELTQHCSLELNIDVQNMVEHKKIFRRELESRGYNYHLLRICEVSLFLSMLPLHIDHLKKVVGFILNAMRIMEELDDK